MNFYEKNTKIFACFLILFYQIMGLTTITYGYSMKGSLKTKISVSGHDTDRSDTSILACMI